MFDVTNKHSFEQLDSFIEYTKSIKRNDETSSTPAIIIGTKCDASKRSVTLEEAYAKAAKYNLRYLETSAKTGEGVSQALEMAAKLAVKNWYWTSTVAQCD